MSSRYFWYSGFLIVLASLLSYWSITLSDINRQANSQGAAIRQDQLSQLDSYLQQQDDAYKLVKLAKAFTHSTPELVEPVIDRAYALKPTSPDIVLLDSVYHPELKEKATYLNPLRK